MNHIQRLTEDNADKGERITATAEALQDFRVFLLSDKFSGVDTNGERKDWIATGDVQRQIDSLLSILNGTD